MKCLELEHFLRADSPFDREKDQENKNVQTSMAEWWAHVYWIPLSAPWPNGLILFSTLKRPSAPPSPPHHPSYQPTHGLDHIPSRNATENWFISGEGQGRIHRGSRGLRTTRSRKKIHDLGGNLSDAWKSHLREQYSDIRLAPSLIHPCRHNRQVQISFSARQVGCNPPDPSYISWT